MVKRKSGGRDGRRSSGNDPKSSEVKAIIGENARMRKFLEGMEKDDVLGKAERELGRSRK